MNCDSTFGPLSVDFANAGTLYPQQSSFKYGKDIFDTFYCKFDANTASKIGTDLNAALNEVQRAVVKINGEPVRSMYYEPKFMKIGSTERTDQYTGFLELHDLHEHLKKGNVVYASSTSTVEDTFDEIYSSRVKQDLFTGYEVNAKDGKVLQYQAEEDLIKIDFGSYNPWKDSDSGGIKYSYGIHFDGDTPLEALKEARNKHGVGTHISPEGKLIIGSYGEPTTLTASRLGKETDYHIESSAFSNATQKLSKVKIRGPEIPEKRTARTKEDAQERLAKFLNPTKDTDRYRLHITVNNESVDNGSVKKTEVDNVDPTEDNLISLGKRYYQAADLNENSGRLTVDMETSKTKTVPEVGDVLKVKPFSQSCTFTNNIDISGNYLIYKVNHNIDTTWETTMNLAQPLVSRDDLTVGIELYHLNEEQTYTFEEVYGYNHREYIEATS